MFVMDYPSFTIKSDWYSRPIDALGVPKEKKMDCIFNTYTGKTFILLLGSEEYLYRPKSHGMIYYLLPGLDRE
jgi:hypothetical protein